MPKYRYLCDVCGAEYLRYKRIENIDEPEFCVHKANDVPLDFPWPAMYAMRRLFTASFQIIGRPEKDNPENQLYNILTKGGGETDKLALMRAEEKRMERTYDSLQPAAKPAATMDDLLSTGIMEAAKRPDSLHNWREANIKEKTFSEGETIPL